MTTDAEASSETLFDRVYDALVWMTGSPSFGPGGEAEKGFHKIVRPLLDELSVLRQSQSSNDHSPVGPHKAKS